VLNSNKLALSVCVLAALTACAQSPIPMPENFPISSQLKVRAAGHWQAMARDVAGKTVASLRNSNVNAPVFIFLPDTATEFDRAFRDFLTTELVNLGVKVQVKPEGALTVSYTTQVVEHADPRPNFSPGMYTKLTAGLWVLGAIAADSALGAGVATLGLAGAKDYADSVDTNGASGMELILTTTVHNGEHLAARKTDVFYVEAPDAKLYRPLVTTDAGKTMKVVER